MEMEKKQLLVPLKETFDVSSVVVPKEVKWYCCNIREKGVTTSLPECLCMRCI